MDNFLGRAAQREAEERAMEELRNLNLAEIFPSKTTVAESTAAAPEDASAVAGREPSFVFKASDGEFEVSAEQVERLMTVSEYFGSMLQPHTREATTRFIEKPNWTCEVAKVVVALLLKETGSVFPGIVGQVSNALQEILVQDKFAFCWPDGQPISLSLLGNFTDLWKATTVGRHSFTLKNLRNDTARLDLNRLAAEGVFALTLDGMISIWPTATLRPSWGTMGPWRTLPTFSLHSGREDVAAMMISLRARLDKDNMTSSAVGEIFTGPVTVGRAAMMITQEGDKKVFSTEELSLRVVGFGPGFLGVRDHTVQEIVTASHAQKGYLHKGNSPGYYLGGQEIGGCPTYHGNACQLLAALTKNIAVYQHVYQQMTLQVDSAVSKCSLRVAAPSKATLARLLAAVSLLQKNPGTLGFDIDTNAFFAVKTWDDMKILLAALDKGSKAGAGEAVVGKGLVLTRLTDPCGVF